jgi:hypothetical protein
VTLSSKEMIEMLDEFAILVSRAVRHPWDEIRVHYESVVVEDEPRVVFTSDFVHDGRSDDLKLPLEALDSLAKLQQARPEGQAERWTWLQFSMARTGKYKFDYKYDYPPLIKQRVEQAKAWTDKKVHH